MALIIIAYLFIAYCILRAWKPPQPHPKWVAYQQRLNQEAQQEVVEAEIVDYQPRTYMVQALNTCNHPFDEMPLTELQDHLYEQHFEVWNVIGERSPSPAKWRAEHAADHGFATVWR